MISKNDSNLDEKVVSEDNSGLDEKVVSEDNSGLDEKVTSKDLVSENIVQESIQNASEDSSLSKNETVETNCLALTVRKDYSLSIFKNSIFTPIRMSIKVAVLTAILNVIKLYF